MKFTLKEPTPFLMQYNLEGREDKNDRLTMYNELLFRNIHLITGTKQKSMIIINEVFTGGLIFANPKFIDNVLKHFRRAKPYMEIEEVIRETSRNKRLTRLVFRAKKRVD